MTVLTSILYIILAIVILMIMIVIHEFGHYTAGKLLNFKITEFSVGFGPKIFQKRKKNGELFSLRAIPLGGYCAFEGDEEDNENKDDDEQSDVLKNEPFEEFSDAAEKDEKENAQSKNSLVSKMGEGKAFNAEKPWKRIIVFVAGALFNLLSAVIFSVIYISVIGYASPTVTAVYQKTNGGYYSELQGANVIGAEADGTPIYDDSGDVILAVNGKKISVLRTFEDLVKKVKLGESVTFTVERNGETIDVDVTKQVIESDGEQYEGFGFLSTRNYKKVGFGSALLYSVPFTGKMSWTILGTFGQLITGQLPISSLSGPVGTITQIADLSHENWRNILVLLPLIASNLAVFNLLPIPALDGSKVVFTVIEWIRKKPINRKVENLVHFVGIIFIFVLVITVDLIRLFT